jgi:hypothetical protein
MVTQKSQKLVGDPGHVWLSAENDLDQKKKIHARIHVLGSMSWAETEKPLKSTTCSKR